jgi:hypothetical protein
VRSVSEAATDFSTTIAGLEEATRYVIFVVAQDLAGNLQEVATQVCIKGTFVLV